MIKNKIITVQLTLLMPKLRKTSKDKLIHDTKSECMYSLIFMLNDANNLWQMY